ncbi:MAG: 3-oxoacyl-[acyl-carrier-protein] synthase III C-terminal domain-containing protein, partial [Syntrophales bacterium]|nr:3-oxoacyl-[acyl-carrier-protein] synthase III C-terminal domain-containing protein [Syntrophales bacterium]
EQRLTPGDIDLLLPSQSPRGFVPELKQRTGLGNKIVDVTERYGNVHTAGVGMALHQAVADGRFEKSGNIVFLAIGAGITTALALYRNPQI